MPEVTVREALEILRSVPNNSHDETIATLNQMDQNLVILIGSTERGLTE